MILLKMLIIDLYIFPFKKIITTKYEFSLTIQFYVKHFLL